MPFAPDVAETLTTVIFAAIVDTISTNAVNQIAGTVVINPINHRCTRTIIRAYSALIWSCMTEIVILDPNDSSEESLHHPSIRGTSQTTCPKAV